MLLEVALALGFFTLVLFIRYTIGDQFKGKK